MTERTPSPQSFPVFCPQVASSLPGRLRLRFGSRGEAQAFLDAGPWPPAASVLLGTSGRSVVFRYSSDPTTQEQLSQALQSRVPTWTPESLSPRERLSSLRCPTAPRGLSSRSSYFQGRRSPWPRVYKLGAAVGLTTSLLALGFKNKRAHALSGWIGMGFVVLHSWVHRRTLFR